MTKDMNDKANNTYENKVDAFENKVEAFLDSVGDFCRTYGVLGLLLYAFLKTFLFFLGSVLIVGIPLGVFSW